jgi:hypothetical protein
MTTGARNRRPSALRCCPSVREEDAQSASDAILVLTTVFLSGCLVTSCLSRTSTLAAILPWL